MLVDVAYLLRKRLRAFDLAYRIGGEEFVVLLPGAGLGEAETVARDLWSSLRTTPVAGLHVTASLGVPVSEPGAPFVFDATFQAADAALYRAKAEGRDRIRTAGDPAGLAAVS